MYRRFNQQQERRKKGEFRSKLEEQISASLQQQGHEISYERDRFDYYLKRFYTPDFIVKGQAFEFYIEVKGYWDSAGRSKFLAVIQRHQLSRSLSPSRNRTKRSARPAKPATANGQKSLGLHGVQRLSQITFSTHG